jgi:hypothetical protein
MAIEARATVVAPDEANVTIPMPPLANDQVFVPAADATTLPDDVVEAPAHVALPLEKNSIADARVHVPVAPGVQLVGLGVVEN